MGQSRTILSIQAPAEYDRGVFSRVLGQQDRENTRLTTFAATFTWNPDSVSDGDSTSSTVTVTGVKAGVLASVRVFPPYSLQGLQTGGYVSADDTVTVTLNNNTGNAVNLASGTWGVLVESFVIT